mgnify:CR=1 FL=1
MRSYFWIGILLLLLAGVFYISFQPTLPPVDDIDYSSKAIPFTVLAEGPLAKGLSEEAFYYFSDELSWKEFWGYSVLSENDFYDEKGAQIPFPFVDFTKQGVAVLATGEAGNGGSNPTHVMRVKKVLWVPCPPCPKDAYCESCARPLQVYAEKVLLPVDDESGVYSPQPVRETLKPFQIVSFTPPIQVGSFLPVLIVDGKFIYPTEWKSPLPV